MKHRENSQDLKLAKASGDKNETSSLARRALLSFLGWMFLSSSNVAYTGWKYNGQVSGINHDRAKAGALISILTAVLASCVAMCKNGDGQGRR